MPVASSTEVVTSLFGTFWEVLLGPGIYVLSGLLGVAVIFWGFNKLMAKLK